MQRYFTEKKAASIITQVLSALNHLHNLKIVHRDIKPDNIVFIETKSNEIFIKLIDFGTSIFKGKDPLTQELGTVLLY
jgi:serine/threonine protein kinase